MTDGKNRTWAAAITFAVLVAGAACSSLVFGATSNDMGMFVTGGLAGVIVYAGLLRTMERNR